MASRLHLPTTASWLCFAAGTGAIDGVEVGVKGAAEHLLEKTSAEIRSAVGSGLHWQVLHWLQSITYGLLTMMIFALRLVRISCQPLIYMAGWVYTIARPGVLILQLIYHAIVAIPLDMVSSLGRTLYPAYLYLTTAAFVGLLCGVALALGSQLLLLVLPDKSVTRKRHDSGDGAGGLSTGRNERSSMMTPLMGRAGRSGYFERGGKSMRQYPRASIALRSASELQSSTISEVAEDLQWSADDMTP